MPCRVTIVMISSGVVVTSDGFAGVWASVFAMFKGRVFEVVVVVGIWRTKVFSRENWGCMNVVGINCPIPVWLEMVWVSEC